MTELDERLRAAFDRPRPVALSELPRVAGGRRRRRRHIRVGTAIAACVAVLGTAIGVAAAHSSDSRTAVSVGPALRPATTAPHLGSGRASIGVAPVLPASASKVLTAPLSALLAASNGVTIPHLMGGYTISMQPPLTSGDKPEVLYIGAGYCPYCAAERWPLVAALAKFGTFSNLGAGASSSTDVNPDTPTFNFDGTIYTSSYLTFVSVELSDQEEVPLQTPTPAQDKLWRSLDPSESIPFVDFGNVYRISGATYNSGPMAKTSFDWVADQVGNNRTTVGRDIDQTAGAMVKALCQLTDQRPGDVCGD